MNKFITCVTYTSQGEPDCEMILNTDAIIRAMACADPNKVKLYFPDGVAVIVDAIASRDLGIKL